ncbi:TcmI family type II polyketide cyclase [Kitasatospora sp. NPDC001119]
MQRVLFIDRMDPQNAEAVADIWTAHDATGLPQEIGVVRRNLYRFGGLYIHLVEAGPEVREDLTDRIYAARADRRFVETRNGLEEYLSPYLPDSRNLKDTKAEEFYRWQA